MYQILVPKVGGNNLCTEVNASAVNKVSSRLHLAIILQDRKDCTNPSKNNIQAVNGTERKANGKETGDQVSPPAKEVAEGQNPVKTG